jgi:DNA polymerase-3 subunit alpha (Gram-positive type)
MNSRKLLEELSFCVIDLETTGGNHETDKIIEIGMVRVKNLKLAEEMNLLIDPEKKIPDFIQKLTSIKQKDVAGKDKIEDVIDEVLEFIGDDIIVAHNTSFDVPFINSVLRRLGREELENKSICTNVMTKHMIPEIMNSNLNYMSSLFDIDHSNAHRAHDDARATAKLLLKFLDIFISKGIKKVNQLYYPKNKFELDRLHFEEGSSKEEILKLIQKNDCPMMILLKGDRGLILGALPVENPKEEIEFIREFINMVPWTILTIRLLRPLLEGLFQFNNHYLKYEDSVKTKVLAYLNERYKTDQEVTKDFSVQGLDFVISHHLIKDQLIVGSFLNLNTTTKSIFKFPAQKKKMLAHLKSQINRFESNQKGKRKNFLHPDVSPIIESYLTKQKTSGEYLFLGRKLVKEQDVGIFKLLEKFSTEDKSHYNFPNSSL